MHHYHSIPIHMLLGYFHGAVAKGVAPQQILRQVQISPTLLSDPSQRLPLDDFGHIVKATFEVLQDEASGFLLRALKPGTFAMMCHASITSPNLRRAFLRSARFFTVVTDEITYSLIEQGEEAILRVDLTNHQRIDDRFFIVSLFVIWIRWASWLIDKPLLLERINFTFSAPDYREDFGDMFPCRHYFNQPLNSVVFSRRFLEMPVIQDPQTLIDFLAHAPQCLLTRYKSDNSLTAAIRNMLHKANSVENLTFDFVAERLLMTTQTLRRHLKQEGNTYQEIKDSVRRDTAIYHLSHRHTPINDIASMMGFSEPSAFSRAFKKWTGITPGSYREKHQRRPTSYRN